jgi:serine phosphatase RsbU (regulator of sigma subunit)
VGGDFYDLFESGSTWTAVIGDVSGKGAQAAALTTLVRHTARAFAPQGPTTAVREVNRAILREHRSDTFATLCVVSLNPRDGGVDARIAVAGHPPPLIVRHDGVVDSIPPTGPLTGVFEQIEVSESHLELATGETLFLYTDGLIEGRSKEHGVFGEERLRRALAETSGASLGEEIDAVFDRAERFAPGFPADDVAILAIRPTR